ncbi:PIN domain-containing protein [Candidatus Acetothermia bacterium]|nr:PIN domain-containing protein [Candidatus Acetothermia bacterium]
MAKFFLLPLFFAVLIGLGMFVAVTQKLGAPLGPFHQDASRLLIGGFSGFLFALLTLLTSALINRQLEQGKSRQLVNGGLTALVGATLGFIAFIILDLIFKNTSDKNTPESWLALTQGLIFLFFTMLGFRVGYREENILVDAFRGGKAGQTNRGPKLLDTSVIIDGRIGDLVKTGFIEGKLIIPQFVLDELHNIADSSDNLRRRKGRRGLDILGELRRSENIEAEMISRDFPELGAVDRKLIQLAKEMNAKIITTDYNLNKVAKVENIDVLNINELANAVKPRFIPGEELEVEVIDRGEEIGQGVGYLDDGTMVVVENGRRFIGKKIKTVVNSALQTDAGKMLFVRPKTETNSMKDKWAQ